MVVLKKNDVNIIPSTESFYHGYHVNTTLAARHENTKHFVRGYSHKFKVQTNTLNDDNTHTS